MPIPAYFNAFLTTCGLQRRSVLNKTQMQAKKLQFPSPGFEELPGYRQKETFTRQNSWQHSGRSRWV
jgi:hypothetical protein